MSHETTEQTATRPEGVIGLAELRVLPGAWSFTESEEPLALDADVLAVVLDDDGWSASTTTGAARSTCSTRS